MTANLGWMMPLQCVASLGQAINFGAGGFQTPITMPVLRNEAVSAVHAGILVKDLLHRSEIIFPPLNAISTVANLAMTITAFLNKDVSAEAAAKLPWLAASFALAAGVTVYTLTLMVPINTALKDNAQKLLKDADDADAQRKFREAQATWQTFNMGRGCLMISGAITSIIGLTAYAR